ncbi:MAG TPA: SDR family oxidoreductase [Alphaproteobacteria bacterium]|nr:SDR family oxidoreductase [Alphaproteobacteria bacterium]
MPQGNKRLFCFGYGYTADYLGHALQISDDAWTVGGTTRDSERRRELLARRVRARIFDADHPIEDPRLVFGRISHLLISTPPNDLGDPVFNTHAQDLINLPNLKWVGYLSSAAVYGDRGGGQVNETSEVRPTSQRGSRRALAEKQWLSLHQKYGLPVHIFRLAGIYGPGRSALDSVRAGVARRIDKPGHVFNRIHVEDIVQTLLASFAKPNPGGIYNLADDMPVPSHEVIAYACQLLGLAIPPVIPFSEADLAPITLSFYKDNKHVLNDRIKNELGVHLKYPDFRSGLEGCLRAEEYAQAQQQETA